MNKHEIVFNIINDKCYFTSNHCDYFETFSLSNRFVIFQKLFDSNKIAVKIFYLSFSKKNLNVQKYQIFQKRFFSTLFRIKFFRFTIENSNKFFFEKSLNSNFRFAIEKIDKKYFFAKSFKKQRKIKIIRKVQRF